LGDEKPLFRLFYVHHQLHLGMNVAMDLEGPGLRKGFGNILARFFSSVSKLKLSLFE
jgi:hypothetical protein